MLKQICLVATLIAYAAVSGCATIGHNGPRSIPIASSPPGAKVSIYDRSNKLVMTNTTPFVAQLPVKFGYFKSPTYRLDFELHGYAPVSTNIESSVSGWYFGNLAFGGIIGMLIVDPLTGAMYNLKPEKIQQPLTPAQADTVRSGNGILVVLASQVTEGELSQMVPVN